MRAIASLAACFVAACSVSHDEHAASVTERFASADAELADFELDGALVTATNDIAGLRQLVDAQLMYAVGQLNADRSVGRYERLEISGISVEPRDDGSYDVRYHAKLPVAWGKGALPSMYTLLLPARVASDDQIAFTEKYGATCADPDAGDLSTGNGAERMFLFYRPYKAGCVLAAEDVVAIDANVTRSPENTTGKYPEYDRIWEDGALDVVAVFGFEETDDPTRDAGAHAYEDFVSKVSSYVTSLQPDAGKRTADKSVVDGRRRTRIAATLPDGRAVHVQATLVGTLLESEPPSFDAWYDAATPDADVIFYSGHAGHGENVHALMQKGTFRSAKYLLFVVNGCDTFAYLDRTLAARRAALNPGDPFATKYMDTVSNALGSWFRMGDDTGILLVHELTAADKTYGQIFAGVDRDQVIVVTGEEDNTYAPTGPKSHPPETQDDDPDAPPVYPPDEPASGSATAASRGAPRSSDGGCSIAMRPTSSMTGGALLSFAFVVFCMARRSQRSKFGARSVM